MFEKKLWLIIIILSSLLCVSGCSDIKNADPTKISQSEYEKLQNGVDYKKACEIIGSGGKVITKTDDDNEKKQTIMYTWEKEDGGVVYLTFQEEKLVNKSQY